MRRVQNGVSREVEFVERVHPENAGAVNRHTDRVVFLYDERAETGGCEIARRQEPRGTAAHNDNVTPIGR